MKHLSCVLRQVNGIDQYRPVDDVPFLNEGETVFTGVFRIETERAGPSGSHTVRIALPVGELNRTPVEKWQQCRK